MNKDEVYDYKKRKFVKMPKEMNDFLNEIIEIYKKYNLSISHEDSNGAFIIEEYSENDVVWLKDANKNY